MFRRAEDRSKSGEAEPYVRFFSNVAILNTIQCITIFLAVTTLLVPVFILALQPMSPAVMSTVALVAVLVFCLVFNFTTGARTQDVFVGTAA
jgi:hypothetical protein